MENWTPPDLHGRIAWVAGATRGTGRGIAVALGQAGATVLCTGRSTRATQSPMGRPETIEKTAELVTAAGGVGIARRVDHTKLQEIRDTTWWLEEEYGALDIMVNDLWGGDPWVAWGQPFWKPEPETQWALIENTLKSHLQTAMAVAPLLQRRRGLLVEVTDGNTMGYRSNVVYDLVKTAILRMTWGFAQDFNDADCIAVTPGFLRSEAMLDHFGVTETTWEDAIEDDPHFAASETPNYLGRGIACLAADPKRRTWHGQVRSSWELANHYGFDDVDGRHPDWGKHWLEAFKTPLPAMDAATYRAWSPLLPGSGSS